MLLVSSLKGPATLHIRVGSYNYTRINYIKLSTSYHKSIYEFLEINPSSVSV